MNGELFVIVIILVFIAIEITTLNNNIVKIAKKYDNKPCIHGHNDWDDCPDCGH